MQAKDIEDFTMIMCVAECTHDSLGANFTEICEHMPGVPPRVIRAKLRKLIKRKIIQGCTCGCRGDFIISPPIQNSNQRGNRAPIT